MKSCAAAIRAAFSICAGGRLGVPEGDVGGDRVREQEALLEDEADVAPQVVQVQPAHVDPVDQQPAGRDVVEPRDQAHEDALARAGRPEDGDALARLHVEVDVPQHGLAAGRTRRGRKGVGREAAGPGSGRVVEARRRRSAPPLPAGAGAPRWAGSSPRSGRRGSRRPGGRRSATAAPN